MPKYKVHLVQTVYEAATIIVEADEEEDAEHKAVTIAYGDRDDTPIEWKFVEAEGDVTVIECEPWPPVQEKEPADA